MARSKTPHSAVLDKASPLKCECLIHPVVALSESADTIASNEDILEATMNSLDMTKVNR